MAKRLRGRRNPPMNATRLTKLEKQMLVRSAGFILSGEWPWEGDGGLKDDRLYEREKATLVSAQKKLTE